MTFKIITGDLFDPVHNFDALAQGVNCEGIMGGGIAVAFKTRFPAMHDDYVKLCNEFRDVIPGLLHTYDPWEKDKEYRLDPEAFLPTIFNLFSQIKPGRDGDYGLLKSSALLMRFEAESRRMSDVGLPWIGCGIAGLERHNVEHILRRILGPSPVEFTLVQQP
jgi:O-acetyl-ADP-ribose deacetylase (regulator of RNase III)